MPEAHRRGTSGVGVGRDNTKEAKFWMSYRGGPYLIHKVGGECPTESSPTFDPGVIPTSVAGYSDDFDNVIDQGFKPCPECMGG